MLWALFLLIAAVWAIFLIPPLWADRRSFFRAGQRGGRTAGSDRPSDRTSPSTSGGRITGPGRAGRVIARRKRSLVGLGVTAIGTLAAVAVFGGVPLIIVHVLADLALVAYVAALRRIAVRRVSLADQVLRYPVDEHLYSSEYRVAQSR